MSEQQNKHFVEWLARLKAVDERLVNGERELLPQAHFLKIAVAGLAKTDEELTQVFDAPQETLRDWQRQGQAAWAHSGIEPDEQIREESKIDLIVNAAREVELQDVLEHFPEEMAAYEADLAK
ncbi:MAG: hypothetical protein WAX89_01975 [Alphaproteobacteria bacterium]